MIFAGTLASDDHRAHPRVTPGTAAGVVGRTAGGDGIGAGSGPAGTWRTTGGDSIGAGNGPAGAWRTIGGTARRDSPNFRVAAIRSSSLSSSTCEAWPITSAR